MSQQQEAMVKHEHYYVPDKSPWSIVGSVGIFTFLLGFINLLHGHYTQGMILFPLGALIIIVMMFGWFGSVIDEGLEGLYSEQVDRSFRLGMMWFIFSEVMFFAAFFGALFYVRMWALPWLAGEGSKAITGEFLYPNFHYVWPLLINPNPSEFVGPRAVMDAMGIPFLNTILLLSSAGTLTWAHWGLKKGNNRQLIIGLIITIALGATFLCFQAYEYYHAHHGLGLTFSSGIYGSTFYMLTGFHGMHVTIGAIMLTVMLVRSIKRHFTPKDHFAFEAAAWYWHFVDVVWLFLFIFVYWL